MLCMLPTDVKSKLHKTKANWYLVLIIMIFVHNCQACFGPVSIQHIVEKHTSGYLKVQKSNVTLSCKAPHELYIITASGGGFYIYDNSARRFICWRNNHVIAMTYKHIERKKFWPKCRFQDGVSDRMQAYITLHQFQNKKKMLLLDLKERKKQRCYKNYSKHVVYEFLKYPATREKCCPQAFDVFCKSRLRRMKEFSRMCDDRNLSKCNDVNY